MLALNCVLCWASVRTLKTWIPPERWRKKASDSSSQKMLRYGRRNSVYADTGHNMNINFFRFYFVNDGISGSAAQTMLLWCRLINKIFLSVSRPDIKPMGARKIRFDGREKWSDPTWDVRISLSRLLWSTPRSHLVPQLANGRQFQRWFRGHVPYLELATTNVDSLTLCPPSKREWQIQQSYSNHVPC